MARARIPYLKFTHLQVGEFQIRRGSQAWEPPPAFSLGTCTPVQMYWIYRDNSGGRKDRRTATCERRVWVGCVDPGRSSRTRKIEKEPTEMEKDYGASPKNDRT